MKDVGDIFEAATAIIDNLPVLQAIAGELEASRHCLEQLGLTLCLDPNLAQAHLAALHALDELGQRDRQSVVSGESVSVRVDLGGRRLINTKKRTKSILN